MRDPSSRIGLIGLALGAFTLATFAGAQAAWAWRDGGCMRKFRPAPPAIVFGGVVLPARDAEQAVAIARRLGLGTVSCPEWNGWWMEGVQLGPTALSWRVHRFGDRLLGLPTTGVTPLLAAQVDWGCPWTNPMIADQPAGALRVTHAIAIVEHLDAAPGAELHPGIWAGARIAFGKPFDIPWLGARAREATLPHGALRLIEPVDPHGAAARWLADGGPRWLGVTIEVADLALAARGLERRGVRFLRAGDRRHAPLIVEPGELGGTLVEFVEGALF